MDDLIGQTLDRYEIVELVGEGGMATVYRARQPRLKRDVAVKVMLSALAADSTFRQRFEREAQAIANLRHPNILTVYDYGESSDGQLYLVVDYVRRGTVRERLERERLPLEETVEIVAQVAEALDYAHQQGVIHRDVKPNNILLTREGRPLLADFGLVKPVQSDRRLTASGVMLGTPDYVAPEQAQGLEIDGRADVYALGVMLFEMLTGKHPYEGETPISIILKHVSEPMPRASELNLNIPPALDDVIDKATAKSPDERYQRAGDMARALRAVLVSGTVAGTDVERVAPPAAPPQTPTPEVPAVTPPPLRPWYQGASAWVALGALLALVVAVVLFLPSLLSGDEAPEQAGAVPTAQPGETLILVAQFKAKSGSESFDVSQRIHDKLSADLRRLGEKDVTVYQVPDVIESSEAAIALGRAYGATTIIWGYYDDIGISPNVEAVGLQADNPVSIGLERFNVDPEEAVNFKLYIAKDLPEELSFLTAVSLFQAFMVQGRIEKAAAYVVMASDNLPADPQFRGGGDTVYFMQGLMAFFQGEAERSVELMSQAIAINPDKALLYTMRGSVYLAMGELDLALADTARAIALDPDDPSAYAMQASAQWMSGDLQGTLDTYARMVEVDPDDWLGYFGQAVIYFEMDDLSRSLVAWEQVEELDPNNTFIPVHRGLVHEKLGQIEQAAADYAKAGAVGASEELFSQFLQIAAGSGSRMPLPPYFQLTECMTNDLHGRNEQAFASCSEAIKADPTYANAWWKRGQLYAAQGDWEAALSDYDAAIQVDPRWPWVYYLRAQALIELGRSDEAQADLDRALELDPVDELRQAIEALQSE